MDCVVLTEPASTVLYARQVRRLTLCVSATARGGIITAPMRNRAKPPSMDGAPRTTRALHRKPSYRECIEARGARQSP